jgi:AAA+ ATPase superfamily predicted ATPase
MSWDFYGRNVELEQLKVILQRERWAFVKISGRRRIGKTTLIQHAIEHIKGRKVFYVQIPDSDAPGVLDALHEYMDTFELPHERPVTLVGFAKLIEQLAREGYVVALDEFQYFHRKVLSAFTSHLQSIIDRLSSDAGNVKGCLLVLGSIHTEMNALLNDKDAPLFNRLTDEFALDHLDIASVRQILTQHKAEGPESLLFYWNLFEGVPKFYRDCYEQKLFGQSRQDVIHRLFFESSSPLRNEAENWFLHELRGRYDHLLKYIAQHPGCTSGDIMAHLNRLEPSKYHQAGNYLKILIEKYGMVEKKQPIFSKPTARNSRYYISDNFLRTWLQSIKTSASSVRFRELGSLLTDMLSKLDITEGHGLESLTKTLYEERSRKGLPGFDLTHAIEGFWDKAGTEIDLVAINKEEQIIRFGTCKRSNQKLDGRHLADYKQHVDRFLIAFPGYADWTVEYTAITVRHDDPSRAICEEYGYLAEDLISLTDGLNK